MAINIPNSVFTKYNEFADAMIDNFGVVCTLVYPPKRETVSGRPSSSLGRRSSSIYRSGGPQSHSSDFPLGDAQYKLTEVTASITLRVYWNPKEWVSVGFQAQNPENTIQVIGYLSDYTNVKKATKLIVHDQIKGHGPLDFEKESEYYPFGFKQNRYFAMFWKRS